MTPTLIRAIQLLGDLACATPGYRTLAEVEATRRELRATLDALAGEAVRIDGMELRPLVPEPFGAVVDRARGALVDAGGMGEL